MNELKAKLAAGEVVCGIWSIVPAPAMAGALAAAGFDFVILDCEHGPWDLTPLEAAIATCCEHGSAPLVRVPGADPFFVQRVLDLGAHGVLVPQIADAAAAARAVAMARFGPLGTRGYNPFTRAARFGTMAPAEMAAAQPLTGVLVESPAAARDIDAIAALPDLDLIYLGIFDYSVALGIPGAVDDPRVQSFIATATRTARAAGKAVGTTAMTAQQAERLIELGVNVLLYGVDTWLVSRAAREGLAMLRAARERSRA